MPRCEVVRQAVREERRLGGESRGRWDVRLILSCKIDSETEMLTKQVDYKIPESFRAFCKIVSFTAANTSRMLDVSVACVK